MPPRPANAREQELRIFNWCDKLITSHKNDCNKWLFAAIIDRAIRDYCIYSYAQNTSEYTYNSNQIYSYSEMWIFANPHVEFVISFDEVCEIVGVEPNGIRKMLLQLTEGG